MITDWILHPFRHLQGGHSMMHGVTAVPGADLHELTLLQVKDLGAGTGWGDVPTPMF
jgi:hypothetical protein